MFLGIISIIEIIIYIYIFISCIYILFFSISSFFYKRKTLSTSTLYNNFLILVPAYKEDKVIVETSKSILNNIYPKSSFKLLVISDSMKENINTILKELGSDVLKVKYNNSSKAKALISAMEYKYNECYQYIVILDADNIIPIDYLSDVNNYINATHSKAIQTHRTAKSIVNSISLLDTIIEEINNKIFRQGRSALNLSSSLIGSGMIIDAHWFEKNVYKLQSTGEDKEIEELLLRDKIKIDYIKEITFKDEKTSYKESMKKQRIRWISSQLYIIKLLLPNLFCAIKERNINYINKIVESLILPRSILIGIIIFFTISTTIFDYKISIKWWLAIIILFSSLSIAIPKKLWNRKLLKAVIEIPYFIIIMTLNLFSLKNGSKYFIHTKHN